MNERPWLYNVQTTLNDAHMMVTDCVRVYGRDYSADEIVLLERIDMAIMHCQSMRTADKVHSGHINVRGSRRGD